MPHLRRYLLHGGDRSRSSRVLVSDLQGEHHPVRPSLSINISFAASPAWILSTLAPHYYADLHHLARNTGFADLPLFHFLLWTRFTCFPHAGAYSVSGPRTPSLITSQCAHRSITLASDVTLASAAPAVPCDSRVWTFLRLTTASEYQRSRRSSSCTSVVCVYWNILTIHLSRSSSSKACEALPFEVVSETPL